MEAFDPKDKNGPEYHIQNKWKSFLESKGWLVERMVGNAFQMGVPDLYLAHLKDGKRWVDIKVYGEYSFTKAQRWKWPLWESFGIGIWILGATSPEACTKEHMINEYVTLFEPPNWQKFWKDSWTITTADIDRMMDEVG